MTVLECEQNGTRKTISQFFVPPTSTLHARLLEKLKAMHGWKELCSFLWLQAPTLFPWQPGALCRALLTPHFVWFLVSLSQLGCECLSVRIGPSFLYLCHLAEHTVWIWGGVGLWRGSGRVRAEGPGGSAVKRPPCGPERLNLKAFAEQPCVQSQHRVRGERSDALITSQTLSYTFILNFTTTWGGKLYLNYPVLP